MPDTSSSAPEPAAQQELACSDNGWIYGVSGDCPSSGLFAEQPAVDGETLEAWARLVDQREARLTAVKVDYLHLCVPDRLTLMQDLLGLALPRPHAAPSTRMPARPTGAPASWVELAGYLRAQRSNHALAWKTDSRWSPWAAFMGLQLVCGRLGVDVNGMLLGYEHDESPVAGDLAKVWNAGALQPVPLEPIRRYRFSRRARMVYEDALAAWMAASLEDEPHALERYEGARRGFRNAHPQAVQKCVLMFGDEHMALDTSSFGGMLAETFREVHLVLGASVDYALVERLRPDVVITQIGERRMGTLSDDSVGSAERAAQRLACIPGAVPDCFISENPRGRMPVATTSVLLASERYRLDPPITAQAACVNDVNDEWMNTRDVTLYDVERARVFLTGGRHLICASDGSVVSRADMDDESVRAAHWAPHRTLAGTTLVFGTSAGSHCYYHWMLELLPKFGLLERAGIPTSSIDHVLVRQIYGAWQVETLERCGIPRDRIIETASAPSFECERALHVDLNAGINLKMHRFVPQWMKHLYPIDAHGQDRIRLYISRPAGVRRGIANEHEMKPLLDKHGFISVAMEGLSVAEQAALLARADVVMSPHGGALTNMVFCRPGTRVIELLSRHVYPYYYGLSASCGHLYHAVLEAPELDYPRLVNHDIAQSFAAPEFQHATHELSFDVPLEPLERLLRTLGPQGATKASPTPDRQHRLWRRAA